MSMEMERLQALRVRGLGNVVRVSVPHDVYFNLDKFQKVQKDILGRLGCIACCSGWDIRFDLERNFMVDAQLNVKAGLGG
jgi:hypothetical protein